jgi:malonyl CoA-acyl carrier protein transacylase
LKLETRNSKQRIGVGEGPANAFVYLIPGQMSESEGMGRILLEQHSAARDLLRVTEDIWRLDLEKVILRGTEADVHSDGVSQPLITWYAFALHQALAARGMRARVVAGYSVGVFSGLAIAGCITYEQAQRILKANFNHVDASDHDGAMLAVGGLPLKIGLGIVRPTGAAVGVVNSDISWTLTGTPEEIIAAETALAGRAFQMYRLPVDWAIHSPHLAFVTEAVLEEKSLWKGMKKPALPFFSPFTGRLVVSPAAAKTILAGVISRCMRWDRLADAVVKTGLPLVEASESGFLQKLFKFHPSRPKAAAGISLLSAPAGQNP